MHFRHGASMNLQRSFSAWKWWEWQFYVYFIMWTHLMYTNRWELLHKPLLSMKNIWRITWKMCKLGRLLWVKWPISLDGIHKIGNGIWKFCNVSNDSSYICHELHYLQYNILTIIYVVLNPPTQYMIGDLYYHKV